MTELLVVLAIGICASSGVPGLFLRRDSMTGQWVTTVLSVLGAALGIGAIFAFWATGLSRPIALPWSIPGAEFDVAMDGLSAVFLMPIFLVSLLGNVYGLGYWRQTEHPQNGRRLRFFYGTLTAGMALLVIARNSILFMVAWEIMALSNFFLVTTEGHKSEVRDAGWMYLVATHVATLCLFALFAVLHVTNGSFTLVASSQRAGSSGTAAAIFVLALVGFGLKAGVMPLHIWLPSSHAASPSHVSAMMSGVVIKMGIYGLMRVTSFLGAPSLEWSAVVLGLGVVSGVLGVVYAIGQHDVKRLLAYHSIENIGIIVIGLGLALIGRSLGRADWIVLGLAGSLLHVWNHALFKALLFLSAGSAIHAAHSREIDHLGGLSKSMPWTSLCFVIGAVAICGLPPLNGFVSEFLIYIGLFHTLGSTGGTSFVWAAFAVPILALIGALALACFAKAYGAVFLGTPRSEHATHAHESPQSMLWPMGVLVVCCLVIGTAPTVTMPILGRAIADWAPGLGDADSILAASAPIGRVGVMGLVLILGTLLGGIALWIRNRRQSVERGTTWACGYVAPTSRMQYTSSSFAQMVVGLFGWVLHPTIRKPKDFPLFPAPTSFHSHVPDAVLDFVVLPIFRFAAWLFSWFRVFQRGNIQAYLLYVFLALIALLLWS